MTETSDPIGRIEEWEEAYRAHAPRLMRLATVLVGPSDAADLVIEAVAGAVRSDAWPRARDHGAYLTAAVTNRAKQHHRSNSRRRQREERATRLTIVPPPAGTEQVALEIEVRVALSSLSPQQRAVVFLHYWEDMSISAVAEVLGIGQGSVRRQLARAKTTLKEVLDV